MPHAKVNTTETRDAFRFKRDILSHQFFIRAWLPSIRTHIHRLFGPNTATGSTEGNTTMKQMPLIQKYMTPMPQMIEAKAPIQAALTVMREFRIRHLPVQEAGKLVGILSDRDIKLASAFGDAATLTVDSAMTESPYAVTPDTPLNRVVAEMGEHKYGCAVIQQANGKIVGIFTAVDALRVLSDTLDAFYKTN